MYVTASRICVAFRLFHWHCCRAIDELLRSLQLRDILLVIGQRTHRNIHVLLSWVNSNVARTRVRAETPSSSTRHPSLSRSHTRRVLYRIISARCPAVKAGTRATHHVSALLPLDAADVVALSSGRVLSYPHNDPTRHDGFLNALVSHSQRPP